MNNFRSHDNEKKHKQSFDEIADRYDSERRHLIPRFDDFYSAMRISAIVNSETPEELDLGAGTGICTKYIIQRYQTPDSR